MTFACAFAGAALAATVGACAGAAALRGGVAAPVAGPSGGARAAAAGGDDAGGAATGAPTGGAADADPEGGPAPATMVDGDQILDEHQLDRLVGLSVADAKALVARMGYKHPVEVRQDVDHSSDPRCDDTHVCEYDPMEVDISDDTADLVFHTRKPVVVRAPPP